MYTIKDLKGRFTWSYMQARDRVIWLQDNFEAEVKTGKNQKYLVTESGASILDRLHQLEEKDDLSLSAAQKQVKAELEDSQDKSSPGNDSSEVKEQSKTTKSVTNQSESGSQTNQKYVELLEERVEELKADKARLQEKNDRLEQRLITGKTQEEEDEFKELGLIQVIKKWFTTKA